MPVALVVTATDGTIVLVNAQAGRLLAYEPTELVGQPVERLVPAESRENHAVQHHRYLQQPTSRPMGVALDLTAVRRDGSHALADGLAVTLSAGVVHCAAGETPQAALARADALLYAAKRGGRNRTERTWAPAAQPGVP